MVKRIIDGKTYNTDTSILVHEGGNDDYYQALYQTKHGAFFLWWHEPYAGGIRPMSDEEARKWLEKHDAVRALERFFGDFPDAGAAEARITLRLPGSLYHRVSASAAAANLSLNTYVMRLLELSETRTAAQGER